jgi:ubiquinone/menaquinone biosynthesis C-methylase UbiE
VRTGVGGPAALWLGARLYIYTQVQLVTARLLSRSLPKGNIRVVQLGGGSRELYYYPSTTVQVTVCNSDLKAGLLERAAIQAGVPILCMKERWERIERLPARSADALVCVRMLDEVEDFQRLCKAAARLLKPGGRCAGQGLSAACLAPALTCWSCVPTGQDVCMRLARD